MDFDDTLSDAVRRDSVRVPPYPSTALRLQQVLKKPNYSQNELVEAMRTDAVFTGNLLRLANSPFYRRGDAVTSLTVAVARIGARELTRLALAATVSTVGQSQGPLAELRRLVWRQSLASALVCEALAKVEGAADTSESFVAGLLHDAGKLLVISSLEEAISKTKGAAQKPAAEWDFLLEKHHIAFGRVLVAKWQLPASLEAVVMNHHDGLAEDDMSRRVAMADQIVEALERQSTVDEAMLETLTGFGPAAARSLATVLPTIPATIAAFENPAELNDTVLRAKPVEAPLNTVAMLDRLEPVQLIVEVKGSSGAKPLALDVRAAGPRRFTGLSAFPLQVNRLVEFHVRGVSLSVWANVQRVRKLGEVYELDLSLFAMSPETAAAWERLLGQQRQAA